MTKDEYLSELKKRLCGLSKEDLENRINFFDEMIEDSIEDGKTEEEAILEIGSIDDVVKQIAKETPLVKLVKERTKPKRKMKGWEITLLILGFPVWFPLLLVAIVLCFIGYILIWVIDIVAYAVEVALIIFSIAGFIGTAIYLLNGDMNLIYLGIAIGCAGMAILFMFACIKITKMTILLSKSILIKIKTSFIRKGESK